MLAAATGRHIGKSGLGVPGTELNLRKFSIETVTNIQGLIEQV